MKATYVEVNGEGREIFKDPITDDGTKKSATGLLRVDEVTGSHGKGILLKDKASWEEEKGGLLQVIYEDGVFHNQITLTELRKKLM
jgi:nicotinamide phosphoribosyltransferase